MMQFLRSSDPNQKESENHLLLETPYSNFSSLWMNAWIKIQMRYKKTTLCLSPSPPPSRFLSSPAKLTGRRKYFIFICIPWGTQTNKQTSKRRICPCLSRRKLAWVGSKFELGSVKNGNELFKVDKEQKKEHCLCPKYPWLIDWVVELHVTF